MQSLCLSRLRWRFKTQINFFFFFKFFFLWSVIVIHNAMLHSECNEIIDIEHVYYVFK